MKSYISKQQRGMSLIELMISMVVGLFLLVGVVTNFIATKDNDRMRNAVSEIDNNAQTALIELRRTISHTGYTSTNNIRFYNDKVFLTLEDRFKPFPVSARCRDNSSINKIISNNTRDRSTKDTLTVIYYADNPCISGVESCEGNNNPNINQDALVYTDCTGGSAQRDAQAVSCSTDSDVNSEVNNAKIYNTFMVTNSRELICYGSRGGGQPLVENVEAMQFLYGVNEDGNISYRTAKQVEDADQWRMVQSIQVGLLLRSSDSNLVDKATAKTEYIILGSRIKIANAHLGRLFRVYTTTINLENLDSGPVG